MYKQSGHFFKSLPTKLLTLLWFCIPICKGDSTVCSLLHSLTLIYSVLACACLVLFLITITHSVSIMARPRNLKQKGTIPVTSTAGAAAMTSLLYFLPSSHAAFSGFDFSGLR